MSYYEYNDLFLKCQKNGRYKMYTFDVVDSQNNTDPLITKKLCSIMTSLRQKIQEVEIRTDKKILCDELIYYDDLSKTTIVSNIFEKLDPIILGDAVSFTVYSGSISDELIDLLFEQTKIELNIEYSFHKESGCYETNEWVEGQTKYFRGYCFQYLTNKHKKKK
ncbi:hypothetical protein EOM09_03305 [bacterium]|nr:hypothetical protein [bacterium]